MPFGAFGCFFASWVFFGVFFSAVWLCLYLQIKKAPGILLGALTSSGSLLGVKLFAHHIRAGVFCQIFSHTSGEVKW